jgi:hypothetical protein
MYPFSDQIALYRINDLQRAAAQARMASQARARTAAPVRPALAAAGGPPLAGC